ncbi:hypothetical protein [Aurantiacibacter sp. MUD61]|uniref:hypothetical protein n=1 Tax=Aurantiacibacter sp. MUD61 TaxID=3009083 RepID=UPI0022F123B7|nr:hypothetical protein [Aurantiacibacter sp. MUD61]
MRYRVAAILLSASLVACSQDPATDEGDTAMSNEGQDAIAEAPQPAEPEAPARETISGDLLYIALDTDPAVAQLEDEPIILELANDHLEAILDEWGGVGTPLTLSCERSDPFTGDDGITYQVYVDCQLPS